jgi:proliferating cell nuclear antigen
MAFFSYRRLAGKYSDDREGFMVEVEFQVANLFRRIAECLKLLVDDVRFECDATGMVLKQLDVSQVGFIWISLPAAGFRRYVCSTPTSLSFNVDTLVKVLKGCRPIDELTIRALDPEKDIEMQLDSANHDKLYQFSLRRIDFGPGIVAMPEHTHRACLIMNSEIFNQMVKTLTDFNEAVTVGCTEGEISFTVSDTLAEAKTRFNTVVSENERDAVEVEVSESFRVSYCLRYMNVIAAAAPLSSRVELSFARHFPLLALYNLAGGGFLKFYLAPKVDDFSDDGL